MTNNFVLLYDKPVGPTSHDIVARMRRELGERRIGHTGTLDPFASGLMLLCVGYATRIAEYLTGLPKSYTAIARFDGSTITDDNTSEVTPHDVPSEDELRERLTSQIGRRLQTPSAMSAKKIDGKRAYELVRAGTEVTLKPNEIEIFDLRIKSVNLPDVEFEVDCSSGTYVRAIARDAGGYLTALRRTSVGSFDVSRAGERMEMLDAVSHLRRVEISHEDTKALRFGQTVPTEAEQGLVVASCDNKLIAIATSDGERLKPKKVFPIE